MLYNAIHGSYGFVKRWTIGENRQFLRSHMASFTTSWHRRVKPCLNIILLKFFIVSPNVQSKQSTKSFNLKQYNWIWIFGFAVCSQYAFKHTLCITYIVQKNTGNIRVTKTNFYNFEKQIHNFIPFTSTSSPKEQRVNLRWHDVVVTHPKFPGVTFKPVI